MNEIEKQIEELKVVPVVAIESQDDAQRLADALTEGGIPCAEITLRTDAGVAVIDSLSKRSDFLVGAGTHPGAGVPGVLSSAKVLDRLVPHGTARPVAIEAVA